MVKLTKISFDWHMSPVEKLIAVRNGVKVYTRVHKTYIKAQKKRIINLIHIVDNFLDFAYATW